MVCVVMCVGGGGGGCYGKEADKEGVDSRTQVVCVCVCCGGGV